MLSDRIKSLVRDYNPWWEGQEVAVPTFRRTIFSEVAKYLETRQILAIVGLHRVGKTVLMMQILADVPNKQNALYFLFDELVTQQAEILEDIVDFFLKTIAGEGRKYLFLDEIHNVPHWQEILKRFYDTREDLKILISGSASLNIRQGKESLAGRIFDFYLPILTFREFLALNGFAFDRTDLDLSSLQQVYDAHVHQQAVLAQMVQYYIFRGPFPELALQDDDAIVKNYIRNSVVEKIVIGDIPLVFDVRRRDVLFALLEYCSKETSILLEIANLAKNLGVNFQTLRSYLFHLESAFLIDLIYNAPPSSSPSLVKSLRKLKKVHIAHPAISITLQRYSSEILTVDEVMGRYVETIAFQHARLLADRVWFWRSPQQEEVEIVVGTAPPLPIEVKYRSTPDLREARHLAHFLVKYDLPRGILVTRSTLAEHVIDGRTILLVPLWLFLLAV